MNNVIIKEIHNGYYSIYKKVSVFFISMARQDTSHYQYQAKHKILDFDQIPNLHIQIFRRYKSYQVVGHIYNTCDSLQGMVIFDHHNHNLD